MEASKAAAQYNHVDARQWCFDMYCACEGLLLPCRAVPHLLLLMLLLMLLLLLLIFDLWLEV